MALVRRLAILVLALLVMIGVPPAQAAGTKWGPAKAKGGIAVAKGRVDTTTGTVITVVLTDQTHDSRCGWALIAAATEVGSTGRKVKACGGETKRKRITLPSQLAAVVQICVGSEHRFRPKTCGKAVQIVG